MQGDESRDARLDALLRALPQREIDSGVDARSLRQARALLEPSPRGALAQVLLSPWGRAVAPALVTGTVATYLVWAVGAAEALYR